jgi:hypothetical protein
VECHTQYLNEQDKESEEYQKIYDFLIEKMGNIKEVDDYKPPQGKTASEVRKNKINTRQEKLDGVTVLPKPEVEFRQGAIQFGEDDWPGYFMRGDSCVGFVMSIYYILETLTNAKGEYKDDIGIDTAIYLDQLMRLAFTMENEVILTNKEPLISTSKRYQYLNRKKSSR